MTACLGLRGERKEQGFCLYTWVLLWSKVFFGLGASHEKLEWNGNVAQEEMDQQHQLPRVSSAALMRVSKTKLLVQQQPFQCSSSSSEELELSTSSLR